MKTEEITIANVKCGGCATTIQKELLKLEGMNSAEVFIDKDKVMVTYNDTLKRETIIEKLLSLGYPEATEKNGLLLQLKSYASCMVGRINNATHSNN
jgi:copper chaperone